MQNQLMNVQRQHAQHAELYQQAMLESMLNGVYICGEPVKLLEQKFAALCNRKYDISCTNATDALALTLRAFDIGRGG